MTSRRKKAEPAVKPEKVVPVADLVGNKDPDNARSHGEESRRAIEASLKAFGAGRSIVMDADGVIRAGNGTVDGAVGAGIENARIIETDGKELIVVKRTDLSGDRAVAYAIADNRTGELSEWNPEALAAVMESLSDAGELAAVGFSRADVRRLSAASKRNSWDAIPDAPSERDAVSKAGDLWQIGDHVLFCGDSTKVESVGRCLGDAKPLLMVTDPPYGVDYDPSWRRAAGVNKSNRMGAVENDGRADWSESWSLFPGVVAYVWHGGLHSSVVQSSLESTGFRTRAQIVWVKPRLTLSRGSYHWRHEPCWVAAKGELPGSVDSLAGDAPCHEVKAAELLWYLVKKGASSGWCGGRRQSTVWEIGFSEDAETIHSTQKPVECMLRPMQNHKVDSVYEPFSGSGTTFIAAEAAGIKCFGVELSPVYCDVIIERVQQFTGHKAVRLSQS